MENTLRVHELRQREAESLARSPETTEHQTESLKIPNAAAVHRTFGSAGTLCLSNPRKKNNLTERSPECNEPDTPAVRLPRPTIQPVGL